MTQKNWMFLIAALAIGAMAFLIYKSYDARQGSQVNIPINNVATGECYIGGCSSQLCTDQKDAMSTCEFRPEYACYQGAKCERQASGQCGWTETAELTACLSAKLELPEK